jgi:IS30 family transposase
MRGNKQEIIDSIFVVSEKGKHLTLEDRINIHKCLGLEMKCKAIGKKIGKDPTTIAKEIQKHAVITKTQTVRKDEAGNIINPQCPRLNKPPYVCNGCKSYTYACAYDKRVYRCDSAQNEYKETLVECRTGIFMNKEEFYKDDKVITEGINSGQHVYHILASGGVSMSKSTVYRHINDGTLSAARIDLPRAVKFRGRKITPKETIPAGLKIGRTYNDYLAYIKNAGATFGCVEMDTVIGRIGGKCIATFIFPSLDLMFGLLLANKSSAEFSANIIKFKKNLLLSGFNFGHIFPVVLTDNGGEFADVFSIENDLTGVLETKLFFCDPGKSYQKPNVEKNHTLFRDIVPGGSSFDSFSQNTVNTIFSHVNSVRRSSLNGKSPYELFTFTYSVELASALGISKIPDKEVIESPKLLRLLGIPGSEIK